MIVTRGSSQNNDASFAKDGKARVRLLSQSPELHFLLVGICFFIHPLYASSQNVQDSTLKNLAGFLSAHPPKFDSLASHSDTVYNYIFLSQAGEKFRVRVVLSGPRRIRLDSIAGAGELTIDSALKGEYSVLLVVVKSDSIHASLPVNNTYLLPSKKMGALPQQLRQLAIDSMVALLKKQRKVDVYVASSFESNNTIYAGSPQAPQYQLSSQVRVDATALGLPFSATYTYSNLRTPNDLNFKDLGISFDLEKYKQNKAIKERGNDLQALRLADLKKSTQVDLSALDSNISNLENLLDDPNYKDLEKRQQVIKQKLGSYKKEDLTAEQKIQMQNVKEAEEKKKKLIDRLQFMKQEKESKLAHLKKIEQIQRNYDLRKYDPGYAKYFNTKPGLVDKLDNLALGKSTPYFSELSLNSLTINGLSSKVSHKDYYAQVSAGLLNYSLFTAPGGMAWQLGAKIGRYRATAENYFLGSYINASGSKYNNRFIVAGLGGSESLGKRLKFSYEAMYAESDSSYQGERTGSGAQALFAKFDPNKLAYLAVLDGNVARNLQVQVSSNYFGLQFYNPGAFNVRNDMMRNMAKMTTGFARINAKLTLSARLDHDNLSGSKPSASQIKTYVINPNIRLTKHVRLNYVYTYTSTNTTLRGVDSVTHIAFTVRSSVSMISHSRPYFKGAVQSTSQAVLTSTTCMYSMAPDRTVSGSVTNALQFSKRNLLVSSSFGLARSNLDSGRFFQLTESVSKKIKVMTYGLEFRVNANPPSYLMKSLGLLLAYQNNAVQLAIKNEAVYLSDNRIEYTERSRPKYRLSAQLTVKL